MVRIKKHIIKIALFACLVSATHISCVAKKDYQIAKLRIDTLNRNLDIEVKRNYILSLELLKAQSKLLEHIKHDSILANNSSSINYLDNALVSFPNPPPEATSRYTFDSKLFDHFVNYDDVNNWIIRKLTKAGYDNKTNYFLFDGGFVIATNIEQINKDASPKPLDQRWLEKPTISLTALFSMREYIKVLFTAQPGYYRSFVFVVSPSIYTFSSEDYSKELFSKFISQGGIGLPPKLGGVKLPKGTRVTVLVYEFKKPENMKEASLITNGLSGLEQLKRSAIISNSSDGD
jgi:hypothetical protein